MKAKTFKVCVLGLKMMKDIVCLRYHSRVIVVKSLWNQFEILCIIGWIIIIYSFFIFT